MSGFGRGASDWATATHLASHPLLLFRMMQRYSVILRQFYDDVNDNLENGNYLLSAGYLHGIQTNAHLTASHAADLADLALSFGDSLTAGEWLKAAREKVVTFGDESVFLDQLTHPWGKAVALHGKLWNIDDFHIPDIFAESRRLLRDAHEASKWNLSYINRAANYKALCRGDDLPGNLRPKNGNQNAKCFLFRGHPYFAVNPQYVEVHSADPVILEVHYFFGDGVIQDVSDAVFNPLMEASEHSSGKEAAFLRDKTTAPAWIFAKIPSLERSFAKLEKIVGRRVARKEEEEEEPSFYMQSYSVGNYYQPCLQCEEELPNIVDRIGGRIATTEFILDDTEAGGETVFPQIGLRIRPKKGSVLIFLDEGVVTQDYRRLRASCPVLLGGSRSKLICIFCVW
ncbi:Prolyl 4-hydroxylase subunit alpha-1 [Folsomia candida]|uniref:Prolyl 4-hydroxylase subunit alpha-1 n=1 Tax=Folsomia candida TaxID=158441 RepID=A0A226EFS6_FOLCA|nr:Prolyl 4-hydroxylase subunit alpha-1 [Folsomia candida]